MSKNKKEIVSFYNRFHQKDPSLLPLLERIKQETRVRLIRRLIEPLNGKFLDVGCGSFPNEMSIFLDKKEVVGVDISPIAIEKQRERFPKMKFEIADAQSLPFEKKSFDYVVCSETIEHLPDDERFFKEAHRVLNKDGLLIITTPNWLSLYGLARFLGEKIFKRPLTAANQPIDHWYTPTLLEKKLSNKFEIVKKFGIWFFPPTGKGRYKIPDILTLPLIVTLYPLELALQRLLPNFGHIIVLVLKPKL